MRLDAFSFVKKDYNEGMKRNNITLNIIKMILIILSTTLLSLIIVKAGGQNHSVTAMYVLAVILCSLCTKGYIYGIITSIIGVTLINYFFMYPYWSFNFFDDGYPLTSFVLIIISLMASYVVDFYTKTKASKILLENEKELEKSKVEILRFLSHDLRTPLTSIVAACSLYKESDSLSEDTKAKLVEQIDENARWQLTMVENLLTISKIENEIEHIKMQDELIMEIIETVISKEKRLHPDLNFNVTLWRDVLLVHVNALLIEQVLKNIIDNAYKYGGEEHEVDIETRLVKDKVQVRVCDYGKGINDEKLNDLFKKEILDKEGNRKEGLGIGLYLCDKIMKMHKGSISCKNVEGKGACFIIELPQVVD